MIFAHSLRRYLENPNATLPTLSVDGKVYTNTTDVISYLVQNPPKPAGKPSGTGLVKRIHEDDIDPNFALLLSVSYLLTFSETLC